MIIDVCVYIAEVSRCWSGWERIHEGGCSELDFGFISTEKEKGPEETVACLLSTHRLVTSDPKMEKGKIEKIVAEPNIRFY